MDSALLTWSLLTHYNKHSSLNCLSVLETGTILSEKENVRDRMLVGDDSVLICWSHSETFMFLLATSVNSATFKGLVKYLHTSLQFSYLGVRQLLGLGVVFTVQQSYNLPIFRWCQVQSISPQRSQILRCLGSRWKTLPASWFYPEPCWFSEPASETSSHNKLWPEPQQQTLPAPGSAPSERSPCRPGRKVRRSRRAGAAGLRESTKSILVAGGESTSQAVNMAELSTPWFWESGWLEWSPSRWHSAGDTPSEQLRVKTHYRMKWNVLSETESEGKDCVYQCYRAWTPGPCYAPSWRSCSPTAAQPRPPSADLTNNK